MNPASLIKNNLQRIEEILNELPTLEQFESEKILQVFNNLKSSYVAVERNFSEFAKLTNNGKGFPEVRAQLKELKSWLAAYSNKNEFLSETIPLKLRRKQVFVDSSTLDLYQTYTEEAIKFMDSLPGYFQSTKANLKNMKEKLIPFEGMKKHLERNLGLYDLPESELFRSAAKQNSSETTEGIIHTPTRTINSIKSLLKAVGKFIQKVQNAMENLDESGRKVYQIIAYLDEADLTKIYSKVNHRTSLISRLVKLLSSTKKTIEETQFQNQSAIVRHYQMLLNSLENYLPESFIERLSIIELKSPLEEELEKSPGRVQQRKDKGTELQTPEYKVPKSEEPKKEKFLEKFEPGAIVVEDNTKGKKPEEKKAPFGVEEAPFGVSPSQIKKYKALWNESSVKDSKLMKLARKFAKASSAHPKFLALAKTFDIELSTKED